MSRHRSSELVWTKLRRQVVGLVVVNSDPPVVSPDRHRISSNRRWKVLWMQRAVHGQIGGRQGYRGGKEVGGKHVVAGRD